MFDGDWSKLFTDPTVLAILGALGLTGMFANGKLNWSFIVEWLKGKFAGTPSVHPVLPTIDAPVLEQVGRVVLPFVDTDPAYGLWIVQQLSQQLARVGADPAQAQPLLDKITPMLVRMPGAKSSEPKPEPAS